MKDQFQVWEYPFPDKGPHPVVLLSHPDRCARSRLVNVLCCTSQKQSRKPYDWEVMLDTADGLDWETFCDCSILWVAESTLLRRQRGQVSLDRRNAIRDLVRDSLLLMERD